MNKKNVFLFSEEGRIVIFALTAFYFLFHLEILIIFSLLKCIFTHTNIHTRPVSGAYLAVRLFAKGLGDQVSIPGRVIPKTQTMILDASFLNTQHYELWVEQSKKRCSALPYTLGLPRLRLLRYLLQRRKHHSKNRGNLSMTLNYSRWQASSSDTQQSVEYPFNAITPRSTLT